MIIAAHFFRSKKEQSFLEHCCKILALENQREQFIFFVDASKNKMPFIANNCKFIPITFPLRNGLLLHYWYNFKLPTMLNRYNASVFISEIGACSLRTNVPQLMILTDAGGSWRKQDKKAFALYLRRFFFKFITRAAAIVVPGQQVAKSVSERYPSLADKISVAYPGLPGLYLPLNTEQKLSQQEVISQGHEYFLFFCTPATKSQTTNVLKAYSLFKKRLKSGFRLVIVLENTTIAQAVPDFKGYKYKNEVVLLSNPTQADKACILGAAYAFIDYITERTNMEAGLLAMKCGVPVICSTELAVAPIFNDAALQTATDEKQLADCLMLLYKDEAQRRSFIEKSNSLVAVYDWNKTASTIWQSILRISRV